VGRHGSTIRSIEARLDSLETRIAALENDTATPAADAGVFIGAAVDPVISDTVAIHGRRIQTLDVILRWLERRMLALESRFPSLDTANPVVVTDLDFHDDGCDGITSTNYCQWCWKWIEVHWMLCSCDTRVRYYDRAGVEVGAHKLCSDCLEEHYPDPPWRPNGRDRAESRVARLFRLKEIPDVVLHGIARYLVCESEP